MTMQDELDEVHEPNSERSAGSFEPLIDKAIVVTGPTAAGKSGIAVVLAERIGAEILSLDSIAVYRGMDIGTAKPTAEDRRRVAHHLIDMVDPTEDFSVARYLRAAHAKVRELRERGARVMIVGGTPMFLKGILRGFDPGPPADWEFRKSVEADIEQHGIEALRQRLRQVDPLAAHRIGRNDTRRMIRALEVAYCTGTPISHRQVQFDQQRDPDSCNVFALAWPRDQLHERINGRVKQMFSSGLVEEIRGLLDQHGELSRTASQAVGYREVIEWIREESDLEPTIESVCAHTRRLARRQETWLRSFREVRSIEVNEPMDPDAVAQRIEAMLV
jgi:tRNA dimethylallyltransferase